MDVDTKPADAPNDLVLTRNGYWVSRSRLRPDVLLEDQTVALLCAKARAQRDALLAFRDGAFSDVDEFLAVLADKYGAKNRRGTNTTLESICGLMRVEVSTGHFLTLGPELVAAKSLIDECLTEWTAGGNVNLQAIVNDAFDVGTEGKVRVDRILALRRVAIDDPKWKRAMEAISDAVKVTRSKRYVRFHERANLDAPWQQIALDVARVA
jgi:hypothetical protein